MTIPPFLLELRTNYLHSFHDKALRIEELWKKNNLQLLRDEFHKMKGTGQTYGFAEISQLGEILEKICLDQCDRIDVAIPLALSLLADLVAQRLNDQELNCADDQRFKELKQMVDRAKP